MKFKKIGFWIFHHFLRSSWAKFFVYILYATVYFGMYITSEKFRKEYNKNKKRLYSSNTLDKIISFFKEEYKYKWDGKNGILDHDNSRFEFYYDFGDCDDMGMYSKKALKKIGIKAHRVAIVGKNFIKSYHFDSMWKDAKGLHLFNYGNNTFDINEKNLLKKYSKFYIYKNGESLYDENTIIIKTIPLLEYLFGGITASSIIFIIFMCGYFALRLLNFLINIL